MPDAWDPGTPLPGLCPPFGAAAHPLPDPTPPLSVVLGKCSSQRRQWAWRKPVAQIGTGQISTLGVGEQG